MPEMTQPARGEGAQPLLSVVVPVYNAQDYLQQCLDSVLGSTLRDLELICVDDGSTDDSPQILQQRCAADGRMRVITQEHRCAGAARNAGLREARGRYVHFLDADDWIVPDAYEKWVAAAQRYDAQVCECLYANVNAASGAFLFEGEYPYSNITAYPEVTNIDANPKTLIFGMVVVWNKLYLREFLVENRIEFDELVCAEDRPFHFDVIFQAHTFVRLRDSWLFHRMGDARSLDGSDIRLRHFDVEFTTFEHIWELVRNASEVKRLAVLEACINDSLYYRQKSIGTPFEGVVAEKLYSYWHDYLPLFGPSAYDRVWYPYYLECMIAPLTDDRREDIRALLAAYQKAAESRESSKKEPDRATIDAMLLAASVREWAKHEGR